MFTKISHHRNVSVVYLTQNVFDKNKYARTISLNAHYLVLIKNPRDASVRLSGGSRAVAAATVAAAGGCREEVEVDDGGDCASCCGDAAISVARLSDIWPPLCMLLSGGPARPLGYLRAETPLEENPQALPHRARPGR